MSDTSEWDPGDPPEVTWDFKGPTLWERIRQFFSRQKCDGCSGNFRLDRVMPVSGDAWLCEPCFRRWYPEFAAKEVRGE